MASKSELILLHHLANGVGDVDAISKAMGLSRSRVYALVEGMKKDGLLEDRRGVMVKDEPSALRLYHLMKPSPNRAEVLADSGMDVLIELRAPSTVEDVAESTGLSKATVYRCISVARRFGAVRKDGRSYVLNDRMWNGLRETLDSVVDSRSSYDPRVVRGAKIYRNTKTEVLYSFPDTLDDCRAGFSAFADYGFKAGFDTVYYTTSHETKTISQVFEDAFLISGVEKDVRLRMILILFYIVNKDRIDPNPEFTGILNRICNGERIAHWPTLIDVESRLHDGVAQCSINS